MFNVANTLFDAFRMETAIQLSTNDIHEVDPLMQALMKACYSHLHGITTRFCCSGHTEKEQLDKFIKHGGVEEDFIASRYQDPHIIFAVKDNNADYLIEAYFIWSSAFTTENHLKFKPSFKILRLMNSRDLSGGPYFAIKVEVYHNIEQVTATEAVQHLNDYCRIVYDLQNVGKNVSPFPSNCVSFPGVTNPRQAHFQRQMENYTAHGYYVGTTPEQNNALQNEVRKQYGILPIPTGKPVTENQGKSVLSDFMDKQLNARREHKDQNLYRQYQLVISEGDAYIPESMFTGDELKTFKQNPQHPYNTYLTKWEKQPTQTRLLLKLRFSKLGDISKANIVNMTRKLFLLQTIDMSGLTILELHQPLVILKEFGYLVTGLGKDYDERNEQDAILDSIWDKLTLLEKVNYYNSLRADKGLEPLPYVECASFDIWLLGHHEAAQAADKVKQAVLAYKHR